MSWAILSYAILSLGDCFDGRKCRGRFCRGRLCRGRFWQVTEHHSGRRPQKKNVSINDFLPSANIIFQKPIIFYDNIWSCRRIGHEISFFLKKKIFYEKFFYRKKNFLFPMIFYRLQTLFFKNVLYFMIKYKVADESVIKFFFWKKKFFYEKFFYRKKKFLFSMTFYRLQTLFFKNLLYFMIKYEVADASVMK